MRRFKCRQRTNSDVWIHHVANWWHESFLDFLISLRHYISLLGNNYWFSNDRNRVCWVVLGLLQDGACTDLVEISAWIAWRQTYRMLPISTHLFSHWSIPLRGLFTPHTSKANTRLTTGLNNISGFSRKAVGRFPTRLLGDFLHRYCSLYHICNCSIIHPNVTYCDMQ
jgi:hypothetical protein